MKTAERILVKAAIIQFIFLLLSQLIGHQFAGSPQLKPISKYEGVTKISYTRITDQ